MHGFEIIDNCIKKECKRELWDFGVFTTSYSTQTKYFGIYLLIQIAESRCKELLLQPIIGIPHNILSKNNIS